VGFVPIAYVLQHRLLLRKRASGAGAEREERVFAVAVRKAPARVLAAQASNDGLRRTDCDRPGPARRRVVRKQSYSAKSAQADFRDAEAGFDAAAPACAGVDAAAPACAGVDAAAPACAGVDQSFAERPTRKAQVQHFGVAAQYIRQLGGVTVDADGIDGAHCFDS